jgi:hypothetical protein
MSTINVDNVLPQSVARVVVGGCPMEYDVSTRALTLGDFISNSITGLDNTIVGHDCGSSLTTGANNTAVGAYALQDSINGGSNSAFGHGALGNATSGSFNVAVGAGAMSNNLTGFSNVGIGINALNQGASGNNNVGLGMNAGLTSNGNNNVYIGYLAAQLQLVGDNNITIGNNAANSSTTVSNEITLGNSSNTVLRCAVTSITSLSDARDKKEVTDLSAGLEFVNTLRPVEFTWDERDEEGRHDIKDFGFIAQDLKKSQEDAGLTETLQLVYESNPEKLEASYGKLIPVLVKAIQDLSKEIEILKSK